MPDSNASYEAPYSRVHQHRVGAVGTAGNDLNSALTRCAATGVLDSVTYVPDSAITGADTNTRKVVLVNKGAAGSGTTVMATLQFNSGVNAAAYVEKTITLSTTASDLAISAGDILAWQSTHVGTGITDPGGLVIVTIGRT